MALVAPSDAGIGRRIGPFLLTSVVHTAAQTLRRAARDEVVALAAERLRHDITVIQLTACERDT